MDDSGVELKFRVEHYRVPRWPYGPRNGGHGRVPSRLLRRYSRRYGFHFGPEYEPNEHAWVRPQEKGGLTIVRLLDDYGNEIVNGEARCSFDDNFSYKRGVRIAMGRAIKNYVLKFAL